MDKTTNKRNRGKNNKQFNKNNSNNRRPKYEVSKTETFVNPYNFVDVDLDYKPTKDMTKFSKEGTLTGWIDYTITARTPLAIPDVEKVTVEKVNVESKKGDTKVDHKKYPFMRRPDGDKKLMIPGSALRGVIRNVFETATDSCFSTYKENMFITARQGAMRGQTIKSGILKIERDSSFALYSADFYMLRVKKYGKNARSNPQIWDDSICAPYNLKEDDKGRYIEYNDKKYYSGDHVSFEILKDDKGNAIQYKNRLQFKCGKVAKSLTDGKGIDGILVLGEPIGNKHHERIFVKGEKLEYDTSTLKNAFEGLKTTLETYRDESVNREYRKGHKGYSRFEEMKRNGEIPIYYKTSLDGKHLYFQLAAVGRIAFDNDMNQLTREKKPCSKRAAVCPACSLFGMIGDTSIGSRLRFTDAECVKKVGNEEKTLSELSTPRPSYMPFYSTMPNNKNMNVGYDDEGIDIRGRKYYWHHYPSAESLNAVKTNRNASMEVVFENSEFSGSIYFNSITEEELKKLIWALNYWENDPKGEYCQKIGHGKPLGLGSCKISVDIIRKRSFVNDEYDITIHPVDYSEKEPVENTDAVKRLKKISMFHAVKNEYVRYPYIVVPAEVDPNDKKFDGYQWFGENKKAQNKKVQLLPNIINENQSLKALIPTDNKK